LGPNHQGIKVKLVSAMHNDVADLSAAYGSSDCFVMHSEQSGGFRDRDSERYLLSRHVFFLIQVYYFD